MFRRQMNRPTTFYIVHDAGRFGPCDSCGREIVGKPAHAWRVSFVLAVESTGRRRYYHLACAPPESGKRYNL